MSSLYLAVGGGAWIIACVGQSPGQHFGRLWFTTEGTGVCTMVLQGSGWVSWGVQEHLI